MPFDLQKNVGKAFSSEDLRQLCPTRGHRASCGPGEGFVRLSLGLRCSKSILHTGNLS